MGCDDLLYFGLDEIHYKDLHKCLSYNYIDVL